MYAKTFLRLHKARYFFCFFLISFLIKGSFASAAGIVPDTLKTEKTSLVKLHYSSLYDFYLKNYNIELTDEDDLALFAMAKRWLKTPYRWGGRSKRGVDCQGFAAVIYDSLYCRTLPGGAGSQYLQTKPVKKENLKAGDLVFFKYGGYYITHVGVYLKDGKFVHSSSYGIGVIISDLNELYYRRWFFSGGRFTEAESISNSNVL